jgi:DNA-binding response OmpR family regulator
MNRILLTDDDPSVRATIRMLLEEEGFEVLEACDGDEAVQVYRTRGADLVICDLFMPGKEGLQAIHELRREFPRVKIIAISGGGYSGSIDMLPVARRFGAAEILTKPFQGSKLVMAVRRLLGSTPPAGSVVPGI